MLIAASLGGSLSMDAFRIFTASLIALAFSSLPSAAQDAASPWRGPAANKLAVLVNDSVKGGCWPRPASTRQAVELVFRSAGIEVMQQGVYDPDRPFSGPYDRGLLAAAIQKMLDTRPESAGRPPRQGDWPHAFLISAVGVETHIGPTPTGCAVHLTTRSLSI